MKQLLVFCCFAGLLAATNSACAIELDAFIGHWENDPRQCELAKRERLRGSYLMLEPASDESADLAILRSGDYETGGGKCQLRHDEVTGERRIRLDALCTHGDVMEIPGQFELGLVYDENHISLKEEASGETLYFSKCSSDPASWNKGEEELANEEEFEVLAEIRQDFQWLPNAYCKRLYARQSDFVSSGECAQKVAACMGQGNGEVEDCPQFSRCEYWENDRRKSVGLCGNAAKPGDITGNFFWVWQNGNLVNLTYNAETKETRWGNRLVEEVEEDNKTCFELSATGEKFCTWPVFVSASPTSEGMNH